MASSPASSDLSDPPSVDSDAEEETLSTAVPSSRPSVDIPERDHLPHPPPKRRKTNGPPSALDAQPPDDDTLSLSSDSFSSAPGSPTHDEYTLREEAQTQCLWRDCEFGNATNNDELVRHVQGTHCATGGPKRTKYVCEWGECQRKASNHPSGYALKAHMRSHTKEKPYYCALPGTVCGLLIEWGVWIECDKAFTRSDALAKHMRTVHEPEPARPNTNTNTNDPTPPTNNKKAPPPSSSIKLKLHPNGTTSLAPTHDENGTPLPNPPHPNDNIAYIPAHHPITGQPGFMITYPPDIHFTAWESSIAADQLMRLLRRQLHWAVCEQDALRLECAMLENSRREEWRMKEVLLEGCMESEWFRGQREGLVGDVDERVRGEMEGDVEGTKGLRWTGGTPEWRREEQSEYPRFERQDMSGQQTPVAQRQRLSSPSPPPTGHSGGGGFDGDQDPYDNYLAGRMAEYEERQRLRSVQNTPQKQSAAEADAVGALMGLSGK
ncbi:hypothetical protein LTR37_015971 [Vermiconidia calcicola]|uniref:Uncharacterized protein n=1 Tax=Vermiconidia calcicola TaxID=1690605 RepID=A0ACC3MQF3_9PEZI|nr:hypothetical protein LTR37_015971 [Vermiconidia calcicola]